MPIIESTDRLSPKNKWPSTAPVIPKGIDDITTRGWKYDLNGIARSMYTTIIASKKFFPRERRLSPCSCCSPSNEYPIELYF